ncbi:MAG: hypothetical protein J6K87_02455 [Clostridia bacterium]|nr:hypothetical protein [Clostridia bacterium]
MKHASSIIKINNILELLKKSKTSILIWFCLILGITLGVFCVSYIETESFYKINFLFINNFKENINQTWSEIFTTSFSATSIFVFILELCILSCWGIFLVPILIILKGYSLGLSAGYLYLIYKIKGIAFYLLILLPGVFLSSIGYNIFASKTINFSYNFTKLIFSKQDNNYNFKINFLKNIRELSKCLIFVLISCVLDTCFILLFSKFFDFD